MPAASPAFSSEVYTTVIKVSYLLIQINNYMYAKFDPNPFISLCVKE